MARMPTEEIQKRLKELEFRPFAQFELRSADIENGGQEVYVEGYAAVFNQPTVLFEIDGIEYKEMIDPEAFNGADMSDVIFNYNHGGRVVARTRNNTLQLKVDDKGLFIRARLDGTEEGRKLYEEIRGGYIDRMSFAFTVREESYDRSTRTRIIKRIKKLYDVSAVDFPAYDTTSISARSFFEVEAEKERIAAELRQKLTHFKGDERMKRLKEIHQRMAEIRELLISDQKVDLEALKKELRELEQEESELKERQELAAAINVGKVETREIENPAKEDKKKMEIKEREERGQQLKEMRAVTVASSNLVLPQHDSPTIRPPFNEVSSLIDRVGRQVLIGGETFTQPYLKGYGIGDYTSEGADYVNAEPVFDYATIAKTKITAYAEDSEEVLKLPAADYDSVVVNGITVALRKKITREILIGDGSTGHLTGIFSSAATAIDPATDLEISGITETTLDEIIYSFGGDEDVEDVAVLILSKKDLKAFATLRDENGQKMYNVVHTGNTGTIDGVPYIINSACQAVSDATTPEGAYCMAYGPLSNYTLAIFSDIDVQRSNDYKFRQGMIAHRGSVFVGGNVTAYNGFLRVKKAGA